MPVSAMSQVLLQYLKHGYWPIGMQVVNAALLEYSNNSVLVRVSGADNALELRAQSQVDIGR